MVKFCTQVGYVKSKHMNDKSPQKGRGQGYVTHFKFRGPNDISRSAKARLVKFCTQAQVGYIKSELSVVKTPLKEAWLGSHNDSFSISTLVIISPKRLKRKSHISVYRSYRIYQVLALG